MSCRAPEHVQVSEGRTRRGPGGFPDLGEKESEKASAWAREGWGLFSSASGLGGDLEGTRGNRNPESRRQRGAVPLQVGSHLEFVQNLAFPEPRAGTVNGL